MTKRKNPSPAPTPDTREALIDLYNRKFELEQTLSNLEGQIYQFEGNYLSCTASAGNVVRGHESYYSTTSRNRLDLRRIRDSDRIFSNSSVTWRPVPCPKVGFQQENILGSDTFNESFISEPQADEFSLDEELYVKEKEPPKRPRKYKKHKKWNRKKSGKQQRQQIS